MRNLFNASLLACGAALIAACPGAQKVPTPPLVEITEASATCVAQPGPGGYAPMLERLAIAGRQLRFCRAEEAGERCYAFDLDRGLLAPAPSPPSVELPAPFPRRVKVDEGKGTAQLCDGIGSACRQLDLGREPQRVEGAAFSSSDRMLAVTTTPVGGGPATATVFGADSAKAIGRIVINPSGDYECGSATFVGETVLAMEDVCAGPAGVAWLAKPDSGHHIAWVGGRAGWGAFRVAYEHVDGPLWAFREERGVEVVVQNVSTGEVVHRFDLRDTFPKGAAGNLLTDPSRGAMLETDRGELVVVHDGHAQGTVVILDPKEGRRVRVLHMLVCGA